MSAIKWTEEKIAEWEKEGRGRGTGAEYRPWLDVHSFASRGRIRRVRGTVTNRVHHLFSDVEYGVFLGAEWAMNVTDIREQFPLDRETTQAIALERKVRHPVYPTTKIPYVMTVDFLVTVQRQGRECYLALNAKRDEEGKDPHSLEKLEVQRAYFEAIGVPHHVIYHSRLPKVKTRNLMWIRDAQPVEDEYEPYKGYYLHHADRMSKELKVLNSTNSADTLGEYCTAFDTRHGTEVGTGLRAARMLMQARTLSVDLESPDLTREPLHKFVVTSRFEPKRAVGG